MKINFAISAMISGDGEVEMDEHSDHVFIRPVKVSPVITIISEHQLTEEDNARIKMLALHQLCLQATAKVQPNGAKILSSTPINMNPTSGEQN